MSTDPRAHRSAEQHEDAPAVPRPGAGPGLVARLLTALYALAMTPIATGLLAYGGSSLRRLVMHRGQLDDSLEGVLAEPQGTWDVLAFGLGLLLLASIVATGLVSSAGLLTAGAWGLAAVVLFAVPPWLLELYAALTAVAPFEVLEGITYGLPLVLLPLMGGLGSALALARRRPEPSRALSLLGLLGIPLLLAGAMALLFRGHADGALAALTMFEATIQPSTVILIVLGALLLTAAGIATRWSPYALIVPMIMLFVASMVLLAPALAVPDLVPLPAAMWTNPTARAASSFLLVGGGFGMLVVMLVHTLVLARVRTRARRRARTHAG